MTLENFRAVNLKIDRANGSFLSDQFAKAGDYNGRRLVVQLSNAGVVGDLTGVDVNLGWQHDTLKNTGLDPFEPVDLTQGIFEIYYPKELLTDGNVTALIQIIENEHITETKNFKIKVEKSVIDEDTIVSENSFTVLQDALLTVNRYDSRIANVENSKVDKSTFEQSTNNLAAQLQQTAINIKSFGAKGDGITDDTDIIKSAIEHCITNELRLYFPPGIYMIRSRGLYIDFTEEKGLEMFGAGHLSVIKLLDGQVNQRFAEMFYFKFMSNVDNVYISDLLIDNNARGSTPPAEDFGFEQSHAFRIGVSAGYTLRSIEFNNVTLKDPAADGFNNSGYGTVELYKVINCRGIDRTRKRSDIQMSVMPKKLIVDGFVGCNIESESIQSYGDKREIFITNSIVDGIDLYPGSYSESYISNTVTNRYTFLINHKTSVNNSTLTIGIENLGKWDNLQRNSKISNSNILLHYDELSNAVTPLNLRYANKEKELDVIFDNCDFIIDHVGDITPTGYLVTDTIAYDPLVSKENKKRFINCRFDDRSYGSAMCYRSGEWYFKDCEFGGTARALYIISSDGYYGKVVVDGADFTKVKGKGFQLSGHHGFELELLGSHRGSRSVIAGRDSLDIKKAKIKSQRTIMLDTLPTAALKGDTIILNDTNLKVTEYLAENSAIQDESVTSFIMKRQNGVIKGSSAERPLLTTKEAGYIYLDTTLSNAGKPIIWTGTQWVDMTGVVM